MVVDEEGPGCSLSRRLPMGSVGEQRGSAANRGFQGRTVGALEAEVLAGGGHGGDTTLLEEDVHGDPSPHGGAHTTRAPVEADGLLQHVLLLAAVTRAHQRDGDALPRHVHDVVHGESPHPGDVALHPNPVLVPLDFGGCAVVAHVVDGRRCDEARLVKQLGSGLAVERVATCQPKTP
eukprot:1902758-Pyramimonas_sp.AAC.1